MSETRERSALDLLRELEWAGTPIHGEQADGAPVSFGRCHFCRRNEEGGHAPDCALDAVLRATPETDVYWWCPECHEEVDSSRVTWQEIHDHCGTRVESRVTPASGYFGTTPEYRYPEYRSQWGYAVVDATPASDGGEVRERVASEIGALLSTVHDAYHGRGSTMYLDDAARATTDRILALLRTPRGEGRSRLFSQADIDFLMVQAEIADLRPVSVSGGEAVADRLRDLGDRLAAALRASNPVEKQNT